MTAIHSSTCRHCWRRIILGDSIAMHFGRAYHANCAQILRDRVKPILARTINQQRQGTDEALQP